MPRSLIVHYSQGKTTARVAGSIAASLHDAAYEVDLHNLSDRQPPDLGGYELLGIGSPTYYYRLPFNAEDYVNGLPDLDGLPAFAFVLHGTYRGNAGNAIRQALAWKGAHEVSYYHCRGADYFATCLKGGPLFA